MADHTLLTAHSQLELARSLACSGDFAACREAYARVEEHLRTVVAGVLDAESRLSWVHCLRQLDEEQQLTIAWQQECEQLAAWADKQDLSCPPGARSTRGGAISASRSVTHHYPVGPEPSTPTQQAAPPMAPVAHPAPAAFSIDPRSFELEQLAPRQQRAAAGNRVALQAGRDPEVWEAPPESSCSALPLPWARSRHDRSQAAVERQHHHRHSTQPPVGRGAAATTATKAVFADVKPRVNTGAKRASAAAAAGDGGEQYKGAIQQLLARYSGPDQELIQQLVRDMLQEAPSVSFEDIAGLDAAKQVLQEDVCLPLAMPDLYAKVSLLRPLKGVLLFGPPGTGKTMLAKAVAAAGSTAERRINFISVVPSSLASKYRGEAEKLVRFLFEIARAVAPCVVFFDEIDSLVSVRGSSNEHEASRRAKTELLTQIDGMHGSSGAPHVLVLAATNHPDDLDEAMRRRLEKRIYIPLPGLADRQQLIRLLLRGTQVAADVDLGQVAQRLEGFSGDDIKNVLGDAADNVVRRVRRSRCIGQHSTAAQVATAEHETLRILEAGSGIEWRDLDGAIQRRNPSCSLEDVQRHVSWAKTYGCT
ncbi:hypothetical protein D9Q98_000022 [Chlorella vulgaris]|uniref:AAA+ ATPase domain-containing protein n=1 Tax=Chlorella vulgaris TaxID=3077 RepID=A0A9D4TXA0_CHLVU|nr:hypothetical protein D9Q98_000022 [Chlorella vulgaris]